MSFWTPAQASPSLSSPARITFILNYCIIRAQREANLSAGHLLIWLRAPGPTTINLSSLESAASYSNILEMAFLSLSEIYKLFLNRKLPRVLRTGQVNFCTL